MAPFTRWSSPSLFLYVFGAILLLFTYISYPNISFHFSTYWQNTTECIKKGDQEVEEGAMAHYQIAVHNRGTSIERNIVVYDFLSKGFSMRGREGPLVLKWRIDQLRPREEKVLKYSVKALRKGLHCNVAKVLMEGKFVVHKFDFTTRVISSSK